MRSEKDEYEDMSFMLDYIAEYTKSGIIMWERNGYQYTIHPLRWKERCGYIGEVTGFKFHREILEEEQRKPFEFEDESGVKSNMDENEYYIWRIDKSSCCGNCKHSTTSSNKKYFRLISYPDGDIQAYEILHLCSRNPNNNDTFDLYHYDYCCEYWGKE